MEIDKFYYIPTRSYPHSLAHHCVTISFVILRGLPPVSTIDRRMPYPLQIRYFGNIILSYWVAAVVLSNDYCILPRGPARNGPRQEFLEMHK